MTDRPDVELAGRTLAGRFDVLDLVGVGGMGAVYRARDRELDELVALKVIRADLSGDRAAVERFRREVKLARRVTHTGVARTFELGQADGLLFFTMELIEGESLRRLMAREGRLGARRAAAIARGICEGLAAAHAVGVIHRDIKPDNVLLAEGGRVVLADFGVASFGREDDEVAGTPAYMAPEQTLGLPLTVAADIYAVGIMLHEMVTGERATPRDQSPTVASGTRAVRVPAPVVAGLDPALTEVIARATALDVKDRTASAAALRDQLAAWAAPAHEPPIVVAPARAIGLHTVVVQAPGGDPARLYLAEAVREHLLALLQQQPGLRVLPRPEHSPETACSRVALHAGETLTVTVTAAAGDSPVVLELPLAVEHIQGAARAATSAIALGVAAPAPSGDAAAEALDLLLQARHMLQQDASYDPVIERLERASALRPRDATIAANLAIVHVRNAFFAPGDHTGRLARARELVSIALARGANLAESHLAAGHLELNTGDACVAAGHYRRAIACSSHLPEAHEFLGRMLLEAGHIDRGMARVEAALAMAPSHYGIRWDIARAHALSRRWDEHDRVMAELEADRLHRPSRSAPLRIRFAIWRGDRAALEAIRAEPANLAAPILGAGALEVLLDGAWPRQREALIGFARDTGAQIRRRRALMAQVIAELAGFSGDAPACLELLGLAADHGLFDLHWLDYAPTLEVARALPGYARVHERVAERAEMILDALYGDEGAAPTLLGQPTLR